MSQTTKYECICIMINDKTCSVPLNILSSVYLYIYLPYAKNPTQITQNIQNLAFFLRSINILVYKMHPRHAHPFSSFKKKIDNGS